jgi:integrase
MNVELVGVHRVEYRKPDGFARVYYYAWRGGPRMKEDPEKDEHAFAAEYFRLTRGRDLPSGKGKLPELVAAYRKSALYTSKKESTRRGYDAAIDRIQAEFHDMPLSALAKPGARRLLLEWRDEDLADRPRTADLTMTVFAKMLAFGADREMIVRNPLERLERLSDGTRRDVIWTDEQLAAFRAKASPGLRVALLLAMWTGQRQADLLALTWSAYDGTHIKLRQQKTGRLVRVRVYSELKAALDATPKKALTILTPSRRVNGEIQAWTSSGFRASWAETCDRAKVEGVTFHDLRGTFVTLAYRHHGASIKEIAEVTGHSEREAEAIIRKHYLAGDAVIHRLETVPTENTVGKKSGER